MRSLLTFAVLSLVVLTCGFALAQQANPAPEPAPAPPPPPPAAVVDGSEITRTQVNEAIAERWGFEVLKTLIEDKLVRQEAIRQGIELPREEFEQMVQMAKDDHGGEAAFARYLAQRGMTEKAFRTQLGTALLLQKLLERHYTITEEEAQAYYEANRSLFATPARVRLEGIVTHTIEDAFLARERLAGGDVLAEVAGDLSIDEQSRERGGDMGWFTEEDLASAALRDAAFGMAVGHVSDPLRVDDNYHVVVVRQREGAGEPTFEDVRDEIFQKLAETRNLEREEYVNLLARRANITINWEPAERLGVYYEYNRQVTVIVDENILPLAHPPVRLEDGSLIVPAKDILAAVGARLDWDAENKTLTAVLPTGMVAVTLGSRTALLSEDGEESIEMRIIPELRDGVMYVAPRDVLNALGARVDWDGLRNALIVTSPEGVDIPAPTTTPEPAPGGRSGFERQ